MRIAHSIATLYPEDWMPIAPRATRDYFVSRRFRVPYFVAPQGPKIPPCLASAAKSSALFTSTRTIDSNEQQGNVPIQLPSMSLVTGEKTNFQFVSHPFTLLMRIQETGFQLLRRFHAMGRMSLIQGTKFRGIWDTFSLAATRRNNVRKVKRFSWG